MTQWYNEYIDPAPLNWLKIIEDIIHTGLRQTDICEIIDAPKPTLRGWMKGQEPRESYGRCLLTLHQRRCGVELTIKRLGEIPDYLRVYWRGDE